MTEINMMALAAYRHVLRSTRIAFQGTLPSHTDVDPTYDLEDPAYTDC